MLEGYEDVCFLVDGERLSPIASDIKLETESDFDSTEDIPARLDRRYQPKVALRMALNEWIHELDNSRMPPVPVTPSSSPVPTAIPPANTCMTIAGTLPSPVGIPEAYCGLTAVEESENNPSFMQPTMNPVNSLIGNSTSIVHSPLLDIDNPCPVTVILGEPMDCALSDSSSVASDAPEHIAPIDNLMQVEVVAEDLQNGPSLSSTICDNKSYYGDVSLLVDLFYLPFEHGTQGLQMLQNLKWVKCNACLVSQGKTKDSPEVNIK